MLTHPTLDQMAGLGLNGMAAAWRALTEQDPGEALDRNEWLGMMLDREVAHRDYFVMVDHIIPSVTYLHLYFERHQILVADGLEVESFRPGVMGFSGLPDEARNEFIDLFPEHDLSGPTKMSAARPILKSWEARLLRAS